MDLRQTDRQGEEKRKSRRREEHLTKEASRPRSGRVRPSAVLTALVRYLDKHGRFLPPTATNIKTNELNLKITIGQNVA